MSNFYLPNLEAIALGLKLVVICDDKVIEPNPFVIKIDGNRIKARVLGQYRDFDKTTGMGPFSYRLVHDGMDIRYSKEKFKQGMTLFDYDNIPVRIVSEVNDQIMRCVSDELPGYDQEVHIAELRIHFGDLVPAHQGWLL